MALDAYAPCPCGSGEKYKFCCPKDLHAEFERILGMLRAEQRAAALDACDRVLAKHPNQVCFLTLKAQFLVQLGELAQLQETAERLLATSPQHQSGHAATCLLAASEGDMLGAIDHLQDALDRCHNYIGDILSWGMEAVIFACYSAGATLPALAFIRSYLRQRDDDQVNDRVAVIMRELLHDLDTPLIFKEDWFGRLLNQPALAGIENLPELLDLARFRALRSRAAELRQQSPEEPFACLLLGLCETFLGNEPAAHSIFQELARMPTASEAIAIDAFLLAYMLSDEEPEVGEPVARFELPVHDVDRLMERFLSDRQLQPDQGDLRRFVDEGEPPPKAVFTLLDRPIPANVAECPPLELPISLGTLRLFGRQTDRGARLQVMAVEDAAGANARFLSQLPAELVGPAGERDILFRMSPLNNGLLPGRYFESTDPETGTRIHEVLLDDAVRRRWFELPHPFLNGKTPTEAAAVPELRVPLMAALLTLENTPPGVIWPGDFAELWTQLGLSRRPEGEVAQPLLASCNLSLVTLVRLDFAALTDERLIQTGFWAALGGSARAATQMAPLLMKRFAQLDPETLVVLAARMLPLIADSAVRREFLQQLIEFCHTTKIFNPGIFEVALFETMLTRGESRAAAKQMQHIMSKYQNDERVMRNMANVMMALGLIGPDGRPREVPPAAPREAAAETGGSRIWTPDQGAGDAPAGSAPSKLWFPGT